MASLQWNDSLLTGVDKIDSQHKELIDRINSLFTSASQGKSKEEFIKTVNFLEEYVVVHFSTEENLMEKNKYPQMERHKEQHAQFVENFKQLKKEMSEKGATSLLIIRCNRLLIDWLLQHIRKEDQVLGKYLQENK